MTVNFIMQLNVQATVGKKGWVVKTSLATIGDQLLHGIGDNSWLSRPLPHYQ